MARRCVVSCSPILSESVRMMDQTACRHRVGRPRRGLQPIGFQKNPWPGNESTADRARKKPNAWMAEACDAPIYVAEPRKVRAVRCSTYPVRVVARGIGEDFAMKRKGDTVPYRGIEFGVHDEGQGVLPEDRRRHYQTRTHKGNPRNCDCRLQDGD
jgi:hypothetical protein